MRLLKRGVRDKDVLVWQAFLDQISSTPALAAKPSFVRVDGIYGRETERAMREFSARHAPLTPPQ